MCGRYALHASPEVVALQFALDEAPEFKPSYNVCPGTDITIVRVDREGRRVARRQRWADRHANARGETVTERPTFRHAFARWRCLVPASGFYEWQNVAGRKQPWYFTPTDAQLFGLAGITSLWNGVRSVSLITTQPNSLMESIHDRMPVIIAPADYAAWLDPSNKDLMHLVKAYPDERMAARPVSPRVSRPENDDPSLIEEAQPAQSRLL
jgi:putative SOS response-associated peptidase YedK